MKKSIALSLFLYLFVATTTLFWSCSTDDAPEPAPAAGNTGGSSTAGKVPGPNDCPVIKGTSPMSCKVNGTSYTFTNGLFAQSEAAGNTYSIIGQYTDGEGVVKMLMMVIADYKGLGSYPLNDPNIALGSFQDDISFDNVFSSSNQMGKLCIIEDDDAHIKGYFSFRAVPVNGSSDARNVTQGYFNITK